MQAKKEVDMSIASSKRLSAICEDYMSGWLDKSTALYMLERMWDRGEINFLAYKEAKEVIS